MRKFFLTFIRIKNNYAIALLFLIYFFQVSTVFAVAPTVTVFPASVIQGEPLRVTVENVAGAAAVKKISFDGKAVSVLSYQGKPTAFIGVDLKQNPRSYVVVVTLGDGTKFEKVVQVNERKKVTVPFEIPEKLGGNTPEAAERVVSTLARENGEIYSVRTIAKQLWTGPFVFPFSNPVVTDPYGYSRDTVGYAITHKGTDFRAKEGTAVFSMNRGIVRFARELQIYGKTVIIDHGLGFHTVYMHLSKIQVNEGELVKRGRRVGLSGSTGYAESPHLHVSVWLDKASIDPMKFMAFFR